MLKVLVVDDESLARKNLQIKLKEIEGLAAPIEAKNAHEAISLIEQTMPDIMFVDINMPGMNGIELAQYAINRCEVIFVTAYNEFATKAFDINAIDYLLKPINPDRLKNAIEKAKKRIANKSFNGCTNLSELMRILQPNQSEHNVQRFSVKHNGRILLLDPDQISHVSGAGNFVEIHLMDGTSIPHKTSMTELEKILDSRYFSRIHRSIIVNERSITELRKAENNDYILHMKTGHTLNLSRRKRDTLARLLA